MYQANINITSVLSTPEDLKTFHTDSEKHGKPLDGNFGWYFGQVLGRCVGLLERDEWKAFRKVVDPTFNHQATIKRIGNCEEDAEEFVESLRSFSQGTQAKSSEGGPFTVHAATAFMKFPFYFTAEVVYGKLSESEKDELWKVSEERLALLPYFFKGSMYRTSWLKFWDRPAYNQLNAFLHNWAKFNENMAESRRHSDPSAPIVSMWDQYKEGTVTLEQVCATYSGEQT